MDYLSYPALFTAADEAAADSQRLFLRLRKIELAGLVGSTALALMGWSSGEFNLGAFGSLAFLTVSLVARGLTLLWNPEKTWYDCRAVAESTKSASWQYAVAGEAFPREDNESRGRFIELLRDLLQTAPDLDVPAPGETEVIPDKMEELRNQSLEVRRSIYREKRVDDQRDWYAEESRWNKTQARWWTGVLMVTYSAAMIWGVLRSIGLFEVNLMGLATTLALVAIAWIQTKDYRALSEAYAVTSHDVGLAAESLQAVHEEPDWASAVHDCEAAFSREHTMWLARRQHRPRQAT